MISVLSSHTALMLYFAYRDTATVARFNGKGDLIYVGTSSGILHVFDVQNKMVGEVGTPVNCFALQTLRLRRS